MIIYERPKPGYKQIEVGVIPEDWKSVLLGEVITLQRGFDLPNRLRKPGNIPVVSSSGITDTHNQSPVSSPGVVTGRYGTIGEVFFIDQDFWPLNTTLFVTNFKDNNPLFVYFLLKTIDYKTHSGKSGVPGVNRNDLHEIPVNLPPLEEQRSLAQALSDVDALIAALEKAIAKKRHIKTATMQQLLTGKKRLPGFGEGKGYKQTEVGIIPEDWDVLKVRDVAPLQRGFDLPTSQLKKGDYPVVYSNGVMNHHSIFMVNGPGVVTGRSGTIGNVHYVSENYWPHNTALWVTEFINSDPKYIFYLYKSVKLERFGTGSGVPTLNRNDVHDLVIAVPKLLEQRAIATVLSDMDEAIAALETRRAKTQAIKQGMMQALLTGRVRLV